MEECYARELLHDVKGSATLAASEQATSERPSKCRLWYNARFYSEDWRATSALLTIGDRIAALGTEAELQAAAVVATSGAACEFVDLGGRTVLPGLTDSHVHFGAYSESLEDVDLAGAQSLAEVLAIVSERAKSLPEGAWIRGGGWNKNDWKDGQGRGNGSSGSFPRAADLDAVTGNRPSALFSKDCHAIWLNSAAMRVIGKDIGLDPDLPAPPDPPGGVIARDRDGRPTGVFLDGAMAMVEPFLPTRTLADRVRVLRRGIAKVHRFGLTGIHNCEGPEMLAAFQALRDISGGRLGLRVLHHLPENNLDSAISIGLRSGMGDATLRIGAIKVFSDGSLGSRTALMYEPYLASGEKDWRGLYAREGAERSLEELFAEAFAAGFSIACHAIGDRANAMVLDAIAQAKARVGKVGKDAPEDYPPALPIRIEHAQCLRTEDVSRFAALGLIASMQPQHATSDRYMAEKFWGQDRSAQAYVFRSLLDAGVTLAFGSDAPVETPNPWKGVYAAVFRRREDEPDSEPWHAEQRLTVRETLTAYTLGAARAAGLEAELGSIAPGKLADFIVVAEDPLATPPGPELEAVLLRAARGDDFVLQTVVGGEVVYSRD